MGELCYCYVQTICHYLSCSAFLKHKYLTITMCSRKGNYNCMLETKFKASIHHVCSFRDDRSSPFFLILLFWQTTWVTNPLISDCIWAATWQNQQIGCVPCKGSDQPWHLPSRLWSVCMKKAWVLSYPLSAQRRLWSDWADAQADLSLR